MLDQIARSSVAHLQAVTLEHIGQLKAGEILLILIAAAFSLLILATVRYTIGHVAATLAMIESPSTPAVAYSRGVVIHTSKEKNLNIAAAPPPWRGLAIRVIYSITHTILARFLLKTAGRLIFGHTLFGATIISILTSLFLVRAHLLWTHAIIAHPTSKSLRERIVPRDQCKPLVPAALVFTVAKHVTVLVPLGLAHLLRLQDITSAQFLRPDGHTLVLVALRILTPATTALFLALFVTHRIEAALLPDDIFPIVPFDRASATTDFAAAWRSFDPPAPLTPPLAFAYSKSTSRWSKRWVSLC
ncbi:hypothetical protein B0H16DRAFT_1726964 [Mycena metata]|uniref:Uncharacterized protein n=1 Tax=Mycena metata TaxID=1033252 RepID=A0AAD7ILS4_9AGAR|nr:hypothetical protein B0H16DRAFT_1726964 [Mycena metata]